MVFTHLCCIPGQLASFLLLRVQFLECVPAAAHVARILVSCCCCMRRWRPGLFADITPFAAVTTYRSSSIHLIFFTLEKVRHTAEKLVWDLLL